MSVRRLALRNAQSRPRLSRPDPPLAQRKTHIVRQDVVFAPGSIPHRTGRQKKQAAVIL